MTGRKDSSVNLHMHPGRDYSPLLAVITSKSVVLVLAGMFVHASSAASCILLVLMRGTQ